MHLLRISVAIKAFGVAFLSATATASSEAPRDYASLKLLTKSADSQVQGVLDNKNESLTGSPRSLTRAVRQLVVPFLWPNSTYFHNETLVPHIEEMLEVLQKVQHDDGTYTVGNRHSPPDTGFLIEDFGIMVRILEKDDHKASQPFADVIRGLLVKAGPGLAKGGIHTPNHRWKICSALARISTITENESYIKRIDEWLAEGIDIDADGIYSERSPNYYSAVSNPSLLTVAHELNYTDLIDYVRMNLELAIEHAEPNGEMEVVQSRRQDQAQPPVVNMGNFYPQFRELAILDNNGRFAAMARLIEELVGPQLGDFLANIMERPELGAQLPDPEDPFVDFEKHYTSAGLVRARRGNLTVSAFGGSDWYIDGKKAEFYNRMGSGLSTNPTMFRAWNGKAVLDAIRLSPNFFSMGHFRSNGVNVSDDGVINLGSEIEVPYYLPMPSERRDENGTYKLSRSVDGRFYAMADFENRPTSMRRLKTEVEISPTKAGYDLNFQVTGEDDVELTFELTFREGGKFKGVEEFVDSDNTTIYRLAEGKGEYTMGDDKITFGPGNGMGVIQNDAGEQYSWHGGVVLDVSLNILLGLDVVTGESLLGLDGLAGESLAGELNGLVHGLEILVRVTVASVEVVEGDGGGVERVSGAEEDVAGGVAGVSLEDGPGEKVVVDGSVDSVLGEVTSEVDGSTESEDVKVVLLGGGGLVEHGGGETGRRVDAVVAEDRLPPAVKARVLISVEAESATIESSEVLRSVALDADLVVVLEVGSDTREIDNNGDIKLLQLIGRSNTAELEDLRSVVDTTSDDDLTRSSSVTGNTSSTGGERAGAVEVLAVEELNTSSTGSLLRLVKENLGDVGVGADIERVALGAVVELGIADREDELTGSNTAGGLGGERDLVVTGLLVTGKGVGVGIASNEGFHGEELTGNLGESSGTADEEAHELSIAERDAERGSLGAQPAIVTVARLKRKKVVVVLGLDEVLSHVLGGPRVIASESGNVLKVRLVGVHSDQSVVSSAATECLSTRVQSTLELGISGRVETSVLSVGSVVGGLEVTSLSLIVGVVLDEEVPRDLGVLGSVGRVGRDGVVGGGVVITSLDEEGLVASHGQASGQRTTAGTRADNDVLVASEGDCVGRQGGGQKASEERLSHGELIN
ncbi:hypothetical protein HG531_010760 [Fusarium graminearum]|nr:hypothetical protein HG531_010760 [Fusarium graminearum]